MTPCKLCVRADKLKITLGGGNHRLAVARAKGEEFVPILFDPQDEMDLKALINLKNIRQPSS